jgi:Divergent InlB B-repeat domain
MKRIRFGRHGPAIGGAAVAALAVAAGIAYATIPGPDKVFSACMLKSVGTIRLIDKSLPAPNFMSHCTDKETEIAWNQAGQPGPPGSPGLQGAKGDPGAPGTNGTDGKDGVSVTTASEQAGANCADGGVKLTAANGTGYVCNGKDGAPGGSGTGGTLDTLDGSACRNGTGTVQVTYAGNGDVSLKCVVLRTLTVAANSISGASGTVTSSPAGISCPGTCSAHFQDGTDVTLTATPAGTDAFAGWSGDCTGLAGCQLTMSAAKTVTADFAPGVTLNVHMTRNNTACLQTPRGLECPAIEHVTTPGFICVLGIVAPPFGYAAEANCSWRLPSGATVTLTSDAPTTWGAACASATLTSCTVTLNAETTVSAAYA